MRYCLAKQTFPVRDGAEKRGLEVAVKAADRVAV